MHKRHTLKPTDAFTIVELTVTLAVIGILALIGIATYSKVQMESNDNLVESATVIIANELERYYEQNGEYPAVDNMPVPDGTKTYPMVRALLPGLSDEILNSGRYGFSPSCSNAVCDNSSTNWKTWRTKQILYGSRYKSHTVGSGSYSYTQTPASYGDNTGWGCQIRTFNDKPGYFLAWYSQAQKLWIFKRSIHGEVVITSYSTGPTAPQTCTFS